MSTADRTRALYARRRAAGLCVRCSAPCARTRCVRCLARDHAQRYSTDAIMGVSKVRPQRAAVTL